MEPDSTVANRVLAAYLLVVALLQLALYREVIARGADGWMLYNFEPRLGLYFLETLIRPGQPFPGMFSWGSALALAAMAAFLLLDVAGLRAYMIFEILLAAPTVFLFAATLVSNVTPGIGFSVLDLAMPAIPFVMTSVLPVVFAWRARQHLMQAQE